MNSERRSFLETILRNPEDATIRLVFADWLDERGDPASVTQAQLLRAAAAVSGGRASPPDRHTEGDRSIEDLQRDMIQWLGPEVAAVLEREPHRISFVHGLIRSLDLRSTGVTTLPENLAVMSDLDVGWNPLTTVPAGLFVGRCLTLAHTPIESLPPDLCAHDELSLAGVRIGRDAARAILTMPGLTNTARRTGLETLGFMDLSFHVGRPSDAAIVESSTLSDTARERPPRG